MSEKRRGNPGFGRCVRATGEDSVHIQGARQEINTEGQYTCIECGNVYFISTVTSIEVFHRHKFCSSRCELDFAREIADEHEYLFHDHCDQEFCPHCDPFVPRVDEEVL